jgi:acetylornithine deacetylase
MPLDVVETLRSLVSVPSVNPMGRDVSGDEFFEYAMTDRLEQIFGEMGLPCSRQQVEPKRSNIVARLDGDVAPEDGGSIIAMEAHQDTVPVDGMIIPPWTPEVRDGRIYGRGSCDIKGGMAAMLAAVSRLAEERPAGMPTIVMACSVNEEHGYGGATAMGDQWNRNESPILPRKPDAVIVAEPTLLNVVVAHKGVCRWKAHTGGRAAHSSMPDKGDNAIYHMARVLALLEEYARDVAPTLADHPLLTPPTLSVGVISGGISVNTVPDACTIEIDRRVLPGESAQQAQQHVIEFLASKLDASVPLQHDEPFIASNGLSDDKNAQLCAALQSVAKDCGAPGEVMGVPYGTDAPAFDCIGCPAVVFGPGSIEQAHTCDEWIEIEQLQAAAEIYYAFGKQGLPV